MATKKGISTAELEDMVPKLDQFVSSLKASQKNALAQPFAAHAKGASQSDIQKFLDKKAGKVQPQTRSIVLGIAAGIASSGGKGVTAGIASTSSKGVTAGIASTSSKGVTAGIASTSSKGVAAGIASGSSKGVTAGIAVAPAKRGKK
jgi:hypothetical protein